MNDKVYIVYQHINKTNGKSYIGLTCRKPQKRWGLNGNNYVECPHFWRAIQKYGWDNFDHIILYSGLTHDEACETEKRLISELQTNNPDYGYNISSGGDGYDSDIMIQKWKDPEYKEDMSNRMREAWKDPEKRKRRSDAAKERWSNKEFKDITMQKVRNACHRVVRCIETGEVFYMLKDAAQKYNTHSGNIIYACKHNGRCCGYHWEYA